jgi:hypothetical protein
MARTRFSPPEEDSFCFGIKSKTTKAKFLVASQQSSFPLWTFWFDWRAILTAREVCGAWVVESQDLWRILKQGMHWYCQGLEARQSSDSKTNESSKLQLQSNPTLCSTRHLHFPLHSCLPLRFKSRFWLFASHPTLYSPLHCESMAKLLSARKQISCTYMQY